MDHELRERYFQALENEIIMLMDPDTGLVSDTYTRLIDCPLCHKGPEDNEHLFDKNGFTFVRCQCCGFIFTNPQVNSDLLGDLYRHADSSQLWVELQKSATEQAWKTDYYLDAIRVIEMHLRAEAPPRLLDIGCNTGLFLEVAREHRPQWRLKGVELNAGACEYARSRGLDVDDVLLSDMDRSEVFDMYTLFGVMEHLPEPHGILEDIKNRVLPGHEAMIMAIVPNSYSLYHMLLQERSVSFDGRNHLLYFSEETLCRVFEEHGYELLLLDTVLDGLGNIRRQMQWFDPNGGNNSDRFLPESLRALFDNGTIATLIRQYNLGLRLRILARYCA